MQIKCHVFIATSLDGFIAREDGGIDWLEEANSLIPPGEDCGYGEFIARMDCLILGRKTFEKVLSFPEWPYATKPVHVLSRSGYQVPTLHQSRASVTNESPEILLQRLDDAGFRHVYIDGGLLIQSFLEAGFVDSLINTRIPVLLGKGSRLFGSLKHDVKLKLQASKSWEFGFVQDHYIIEK